MTVDAERLVSVFLRNQTAVTDLVGDRVYTDLPSRPVFPLVRLTLIGGSPVYSRPLFLDEAVIQIDSYGGPKVQARLIVDTIRDLMAADSFSGIHPHGLVCSVRFGELAYVPDDLFEPPKPRYVAQATLFTRPQEAP